MRLALFLSVAFTFVVCGCGQSPTPIADSQIQQDDSSYDPYDTYGVDWQTIEFNDEAAANAEPKNAIDRMTFTTQAGEEVKASDLAKGKNLVVVVTRGAFGESWEICPYCSTQTSRLISNYEKFADANAEILAVYPVREVNEEKTAAFVASVNQKLDGKAEDAPPFPLLLDVGLKVTKDLELEDFLAKPATYIFDNEGRLRYAYVGSTIADRPSVKAMLAELEKINNPL